MKMKTGTRTNTQAQGQALGHALRALRHDLLTLHRDPMPPLTWPRWLRRLPHVLYTLIALDLGIVNALTTLESERLPPGAVWLLAALHAGAVVLALLRPVAAWWLGLAAGLGLALLIADQPTYSGIPWPWTGFGVALQCVVLLLLALRVPARATALAVTVTAALTYLVSATVHVDGAHGLAYDSSLAVVLFAVAAGIGAILRWGREARTKLTAQETLTAEERARRTLLEERSRIARELHDVVAHHMSVISIQAQVAPHLVTDPPEELTENLAGIRANAVDALTELRRVLGVLRADLGAEGADGGAPIAPQPTLAQLGALLDNTRAAGLTVTDRCTGLDRPLPPGVELSAFRIVQEALSNALRHAPGCDVRVEVARAQSGLRVRVLNSRPTRATAASPGAGHGLLGMRERAAMLGGELATGPTPEGGYEVTAFLPLEPREGTA